METHSKPKTTQIVRPATGFRMETLASILCPLSKVMCATSNLKDRYLHVPIHRSSLRHLVFLYHGVYDQFVAPPFGLSTFPCVFTSITRAVLAYLWCNGIVVFLYINDWFVLRSSEVDLHSNTIQVLDTLHELGWILYVNGLK